MATIGLWVVYLVGVCAVSLALRYLGEQLGRRDLALLAFIPILFLLPVFGSGRTILPVDHIAALPPWQDVLAGPPHNEYLNDAATQFVPWAVAVREAWGSGSVPWRNRWTGCGTPLAANGQSAPFFPLTALHLLLPLSEAFAAMAAIKLLLSLTGMWLWLRVLGLGPNAALFGAVCFALSITVSAWLLFPHTTVISLWPWALAALELLADEQRRRRAFLVLVVVLIAWPLGGHIESAASGALFGALWIFTRLVLRNLAAPRQVLSRGAGAAGIALGLTAFALLPQAVAIMASQRLAIVKSASWTHGLSVVPHAPTRPDLLLTTLFPRSLGDAVQSPMIPGRLGSPPEMALGYVGITGWLLVLLGIPRRHRWRLRVALAVPLMWGLGTAMGLWPFAEVTALLPGFRHMVPIRFLSLVAISGSALAAFEVDRFEREGGTVRDLYLVVVTAGGLALLAFATYRRFRGAHALVGGLASQREALTLALATLAASAGVLVLAVWSRARARAAGLLWLVGALELGEQGTRLYAFFSQRDVFPARAGVDYLRSLRGTSRVVGRDAMLFPNTNIIADVDEIRTHDPVERKDYTDFLNLTIGYPPSDYFKHLQRLDAPVLDFLNVRYHVTFPEQPSPGPRWEVRKKFPEMWVFENSQALPRVFSPSHVTRVTAPARLNRDDAMQDFATVREELGRLRDWRRAFIAVPEAAQDLWPEGASPGTLVLDYAESLNAADFTVRNRSRRRAVVVASLVQDGGWRAADGQGRNLPVTRANGPFLAISVPPGEQRVRLRYMPPGSVTGNWISAATVGVMLTLLVLRRRRRRGNTSSADWRKTAGAGVSVGVDSR